MVIEKEVGGWVGVVFFRKERQRASVRTFLETIHVGGGARQRAAAPGWTGALCPVSGFMQAETSLSG